MSENVEEKNTDEMMQLRRRIAELEKSLASYEQTEEALRESEKRYRELIDFLPISLFEFDLEGNMISANRTTHEMFGYKQEDLEKGFNALRIGIIPEEWDRVRENIKRRVKGEDIGNSEYTALKKDGSTFKIQILAAPIMRDNKPVGLRGALLDITERKQAEEALMSKNQQLQDIIEFLPDATVVVDREKKIIAWNRALEEMTGIRKEDVIGRDSHASAVPFYGKQRPYLLDLLDASDEELEAKYKYVGRKGNTLYAETFAPALYQNKGAHLWMTGSPLFDVQGNRAGAIESIRDITEYKQALKAVKESQQRLADIIDFLPDATLVIDRDGRVIAWNKAIESMTGIRAEDMLGKGNYEYSVPFYGQKRHMLVDLALHPDRQKEKYYTSFQKKGDVLFGEAFTPGIPPGDVHLSATASVLRDSNGEIVAAIECFRDETERKKLEERLNRAEKMEGLGRLAGGVAHDLNNVLGIMVGYSELFLEMTPDNGSLKEFARKILQSSIRGSAIVQDLLTLARRGVTVSEVVNLNEVVADYLKTPEFEKLKFYHPLVKISVDLGDGLLNIKGSPVHLGKTVMNLVSNAAEAITGSGEVIIRTRNRYLDIPIQGYDSLREGDYVTLAITDTGGGISDEDLGKIFEPFYTKKVMGRSGTGLGLAVVWGTVKDHNGYIDVRSDEGKGTTFTLYFPVTREKQVESSMAAQSEFYRGCGESILVVDDMPEQRELAMNILSRLGYRVDSVAGGEAAVAYLAANRVDLVVLDMIMDPGIDGLETYRQILEIHPNQKAIIVSGFSQTERVMKAQELGAGTYIRKPYIMEALGLAVRKELDRKR
ncbi:MAG: Blue-light-activated protein [Syntrophus sp. PtaB.Bin001]|nr:MAG: Blue-light-activated protein [Syntrophus sp. PtaB.Bin001]